MIIAVDGPAASGKGTIARALARHFGFAHLDTGLLYRAVGAKGGDPIAAARGLAPEDLARPDLRSAEAGQAASRVAAIPEVRAALVEFQRRFARSQPGAQYFVTFDADGQHQVKDVVRMLGRLREEPVDIIVGTRFGRPRAADDQVPWLKRLVLRTVVLLSPTTRKLGLSDAHNGLRVFNKTVADEMDIRMNGMSHASEIVGMIADQGWRVSEEPVDILYTEYSMSKGQSLINGVNILADGLLARRL